MAEKIRVSFLLCENASEETPDGTEILFFNTHVLPPYVNGQIIFLRKTVSGGSSTASKEKPLRQAMYRIIDVQHSVAQDVQLGVTRAEVCNSLGMEVYIVKA